MGGRVMIFQQARAFIPDRGGGFERGEEDGEGTGSDGPVAVLVESV